MLFNTSTRSLHTRGIKKYMSKIEKITSDQYIKLVLKGIDPVEFFGKPIVLTDHSEPTKQKGVFPYTEERKAHQYAQYHTNASSAPTAGENKESKATADKSTNFKRTETNPVNSNDSIDAESNPLEELIEDAAYGVADFVHSLFAPFDVEKEEKLEEDSEENLTDAEEYNSGAVFVNLDKDGISIEFSSGYCDCEDGECELEKEFDRNDYSGYDVDPEKPEHDDEFYEYYSSYRQHPSHGKNAKFDKAEPKSDLSAKITKDFKKDIKKAQLTLLRLSSILADEALEESAWLLNSIQDTLESEEVSIPLLKENLEAHKENKHRTFSERLDEGRDIFGDFLNTVAPQPETASTENTASTKESTLSTGNTGRHKTYNVHNLHNANSARSAKTTKEQAPTVEKVLSEDGLDGIFSFFESLGVSSARDEKDNFEEDERNANEAEYLEAFRQAKAKMKTKNGTPVELEDDVIDFFKMFF